MRRDPLYIPVGPIDDAYARPRSAADARVAERAADAARMKASEARTKARERMDIQARYIADLLTVDDVAAARALCDEYVARRTKWAEADAAYHRAFGTWFKLFKECTRLEEDQP